MLQEDALKHRLLWAKDSCAIIQEKNGTFAECLKVMPESQRDSFYDDCLFDACR